MKKREFVLFFILGVACAVGCATVDDSPSNPEDTGTDADADGDSDADTDSDADSDADADADADIDADTDSDGDGDADADSDADTDPDSDTDPLPCDDTDDCAGEPCVDDWCCDGPCDGECEACDLAGAEGICGFVEQGEDPADECDTDPPESCGLTGVCDGLGACEFFGTDTPCDDAEACTTGDACDGEGNCQGQVPADCDPGPANQCCEAGCSTSTGCFTTEGDCPETCGQNQLTVGQSCVGCGPANAEGICSGGQVIDCGAATHDLCQSVICGGTTYQCTNAGGVWQWRTAVACDDDEPCTFNDACFGGSCNGTSLTCNSTDCLSSSCDGTSTCAETPLSDITTCGTTTCPADACDGTTWQNYDAECTRYCDGLGDCETCSCAPAETACTASGCCEAVCSPVTGCSTVAGSCGGGETCGDHVIIVASFCTGCGAAGATGTCGGGGTFTCDGTTHDECQVVSCGGQTYHCTYLGGVWQWRISAACDDGDSCTYNDTCGGGECSGTSITCTSTDCLASSCNGTSSCTLVPMPDTTACGSITCQADYCSSGIFYDYPESCTRHCNGGGGCATCTCSTSQTTCAVGGGNECCTVTCSGALGCGTAAGTCADACGTNLLYTGRTCSGCGANNASGTCAGGATYTCDGSTHTLCQTIVCGGVTRRCTNADGTWAWRTAAGCDDSNLCTYNDACSGSTCTGTTVTCTSDACTTRTCNGSSSCTETEASHCPDGTCNCGETLSTCPADCSTITVLLLSPDFYASSAPDMSLITGIFSSFSDCTMTIYNTGSQSPTGAEFLAYDVVVVGNNTPWSESAASAVAVGNALADYIDGGGRVIETNFVHDYYVGPSPNFYTWYLAGRFITDGYGPFNQSTTDVTGPLTFTVLNAGHPVMAGVTTLVDDGLLLNVSLRAGASGLAQWSTAAYQAVAVSADNRVVGINSMIFGDSNVSGNLNTLLHNAVVWLAGN